MIDKHINRFQKSYNPSAEFRILSSYDKDKLIESAEYKVITKKRKKLLWSVTEKVTIDNYIDFLDSKTDLIFSLTGRAFLMFNDLVVLLENKNITIQSGLSKNEKLKFEARDEFPKIIDFKSADKLIDQLDNLNLSDAELKEADVDNLHKFTNGLFEKQRLEIGVLKKALKKVKKNTVLFIRILD